MVKKKIRRTALTVSMAPEMIEFVRSEAARLNTTPGRYVENLLKEVKT